MKKIFFILFSAALCCAAWCRDAGATKDAASVDQVSGIYVFIQSRPLARYDVLGTVKKTGIVWSGKPPEMERTLVRRAQNDYPDCDGIIFDDITMEHATVIRFK